MSYKHNQFNICLSTASASTYYSVDTAGKAYTFAFDFSNMDNGKYKMTWSAQSLNFVQATFLQNTGINLSIGNSSNTFVANTTTSNKNYNSIGIFKTNIITATIGNFTCNTTDNPPVYFDNISTSNNFIKLQFVDFGTNSLISFTMPTTIINLCFEKISELP